MIRNLLYAFLALSCWSLVACSGETEEKERVIGYVGQARKNPYLAAQRYLEAAEHDVSSVSGVLHYDSAEGLVLSPASSVRSVGDTDRLLQWVAEGGHFVCFLERGEDYFRDVGDWPDHAPERWSENDSENTENKAENKGIERLLLKMEVEVVSEAFQEIATTDEDGDYKTSVAKGEVLPYAEVVRVIIGEEETSFNMELGGLRKLKPTGDYYANDWHEAGEQHRFLSRSYGQGRVTFLSDARAFRNPYLRLQQHAEMLDQLASGGGKVVFSLGEVPGFLSLLSQHAWMALYGLLLLTMLWLWKNTPRFGPLLDTSDGHSRNYAQQVIHTGKFLWRHQCDDALLQPLRAAVLRKVGGETSHGGDTAALVQRLSDGSGISPELISEAITRTQVRDANAMVRISKTLQSLLQSL